MESQDEGDSKAPSASTASSTCHKAGDQGNHTRSIVMTGEQNRVREESRTGTRKTVPKNGRARQTLPLKPATATAEAGQPHS